MNSPLAKRTFASMVDHIAQRIEDTSAIRELVPDASRFIERRVACVVPISVPCMGTW